VTRAQSEVLAIDRERLMATVKETEATYQRYVKELSQVLDSKQVLQAQLDGLREKYEAEHKTSTDRWAQLEIQRSENGSLRAQHEKEVDDLKERLDDATRQISHLLSQVDTLTGQLRHQRLLQRMENTAAGEWDNSEGGLSEATTTVTNTEGGDSAAQPVPPVEGQQQTGSEGNQAPQTQPVGDINNGS